jgi:hypothetical protein
MDLASTLAGLAAAGIASVVLHHGVLRRGARSDGWGEAVAPPLLPQEADACPACGADAVRFGYEEEVDARFQDIEIVRCPDCGWKQVLSPL